MGLFKTYHPVTPGEFLLWKLKEKNLTVSDFCKSSGLPKSFVLGLIRGEENLTREVANWIAAFFKDSSETWYGIQDNLDNWEALTL